MSEIKMVQVEQTFLYDTLKLAEEQLEKDIQLLFSLSTDIVSYLLEDRINQLSELKTQLENIRVEAKKHKPIFDYDDIPF